jgi:acetyl esterase/lipase
MKNLLLRTITSLFILSLSALLFPLSGQDKATYYTVMNPEKFTIDWTGFYNENDRLTTKARKELPHHLDLAFGDHPKQRLDLYLPKTKNSNAAVFVFLHGGGFREGDRAHYGSVAIPLARHGVITAVASYRLISQGYHFPDQAEDLQRALAWLYRNIEDYGGGRDRLYVGGHSAGALLSAEVAVKTNWLEVMGLPLDLIKGVIPVSGRYGARPKGDEYVRDASLVGIASPIENIVNLRPRYLVAVGSVEENYLESSKNFVKRLQEKGVQADLLILEGEDHAQTALSLGNEKSQLFQAVLKLIGP